MGRLAWSAFVELSFGFLLNCRSLAGDGPARSFRRGTLARVLITVPLHTYSWLSLISVVSSGADCWL